MNHTIATDLLLRLVSLHDKMDTIAIHQGTYSIDYKEAFDEYWDAWNEVHEILMIGLEHKG